MPEKVLTREDALDATDLDVLKVPAPKWGGSVYVRELTCAEVKRITKASRDGDDTQVIPLIACLAACDADGNRLFKDSDVDALANKGWATVEAIATAAAEFNGITKSGAEAVQGN